MFDSGLGGLSIWQAVTRALPDWPVTYLADQAYCPYGPRSQVEIAARTLAICRYLADQGASLIVIACNTATSAGVDHVRAALSIPVVGVEPAIKPAAAASRSGRISVLATEAMLKSRRFESLVRRHAGDVDVLPRPGVGWVEKVEAGDLTSPDTRRLISEVVTPLLSENVDHIVLGCTHYPFLAPLIREMAGDGIVLDDPAEAIARRVVTLINGKTPSATAGAPYRFLTTSGDPHPMAAVLPALIGHRYAVESRPLP
ncbi:glutamate racemase [Paludibacterium paludis]|uniref:Glutamate racemase n=2 Tax=Paludibacterium paludis TaxID=1225769 RepID=A0A918NXB3_9NEIS|nr:glutamate racemase [Paludibacterium paludis]